MLYYIEKQPPSADAHAPVVVFLHGILGTARNLTRLVEAAAAAGFHAIALDQRGHGKSPHAAEYSLESFAGDVVAFLDSKNITKAHIVGHSMGARVALTTTGLYPARVLSLTMLDAGMRLDENALETIREIIFPLPESFANKTDADAFLMRFPASIRLWLQSNLKSQSQTSALTWVFDLKGLREQLLTNASKGLRIDQHFVFSQIKCPILIVRGGQSKHFSVEAVEEMLRTNPNAESATVSNAGHWLHADNPIETSEVVIGFLKKISPR